MLQTIAIVLIILWLLGFVTSYTMGVLIHILLVIAVVMVGAGAILAALPVPASRAPGAPVGAPPIGNPSLGTRPGNVGRGTPLAAPGGDQLAVFAQGCFWGTRRM